MNNVIYLKSLRECDNQAMTLHRIYLWFLTFALCLVLNPYCSQAGQSPKKEYVMGVFPFLPVSNLEGIFAPIASEISKEIDRPVKLRFTTTYDSFISAIREETFDIIYIHPFDYVRFGHRFGYRPLAAKSDNLYALFSVKSSSNINRIVDLKGKTVGLPPVTGTVTYLALDALRKAGLSANRNITVRNFSNHLSCLQQLQIGTVDACATSSSTLKTFESQFGLRLKRIGQSVSISHTMFAVHKRVPAQEQKIIRSFMFSCDLLPVDPKLRELFMESANITTGHYFKAVDDKDYNSARKILKSLERP